MQQSLYSNWRTVEDTEIPRSFSMLIQSLEVDCCSFFEVTLPAKPMAPPYRRSFSVRVVLPASGWEMMAKVRRREISRVADGAMFVEVGVVKVGGSGD